MYATDIRDEERFYLRLLLTAVESPTSFEYLRTFNDVQSNTYKEACIARGMLEDDSEWDNCLAEASSASMPRSLRRLFANILVFGNPSDPGQLWESHAMSLTEDIRLNAELSEPEALYLAIANVEDNLRLYGLTWDNFPSLPRRHDITPRDPEHSNDEIHDNEEGTLHRSIATLTEEQRHIYDTVVSAAMEDNGGSYFNNASAGTVKPISMSVLPSIYALKARLSLRLPPVELPPNCSPTGPRHTLGLKFLWR